MNCNLCQWGHSYSGNSQVCGYYLSVGDTVYIKDGKINMPCPIEGFEKKSNFQKELEDLLNRHSKENGSNTPDFVLAQYIQRSLHAFEEAVNKRDTFNNSKLPEE